jgi:hypothetical protein
MPLALRRANVSRRSGSWSETDFDVFDATPVWSPATSMAGLFL